MNDTKLKLAGASRAMGSNCGICGQGFTEGNPAYVENARLIHQPCPKRPKQKPVYRWDCPQDWLMEKMDGMDRETILDNLRQLVSMTDADKLQDVFQSEMDSDGYFDDLNTKFTFVPEAQKLGHIGVQVENHEGTAVAEFYGADAQALLDSGIMQDESDADGLRDYLVGLGVLPRNAEMDRP